jgi:hypothetical protein
MAVVFVAQASICLRGLLQSQQTRKFSLFCPFLPFLFPAEIENFLHFFA